MYQIYFILEWHSTCFGRSFRPSSEVQDCTYSSICLTNVCCCMYSLVTVNILLHQRDVSYKISLTSTGIWILDGSARNPSYVPGPWCFDLIGAAPLPPLCAFMRLTVSTVTLFLCYWGVTFSSAGQRTLYIHIPLFFQKAGSTSAV